VVSPKWLERSLSLGFQDRCLHISLDTWKQLPGEVGGAERQETGGHPPAVKVEAEMDTDWSGAERCPPRWVTVEGGEGGRKLKVTHF